MFNPYAYLPTFSYMIADVHLYSDLSLSDKLKLIWNNLLCNFSDVTLQAGVMGCQDVT